ncbi:MAG: ShlB/FhaC/HecB family hemolysin secretion/activation protein [Rhodoferax sp.]|jgi:hemolysin activation/secretion protein|nr:ShlB/FhaC/HecB family hemolysin secretion/activation protein [Rhodoferax sp.]
MTSLPHTRHLRLRKSHLLLATALLAGPGLLHAQDVGPPVLPGKEPRPADLVAPARTAPPLQAPAPSTAPGPASPAAHLPRIKVREIRVTGSTVFSAQALDAITAPYVGREVTFEDLAALRQALTLKYVNAGYINSGALLPDQQVVDGVVEYRIVEGRLSGITVTGNTHLHSDYVADRLALGATAPLNVNALQDRLQILLQGPFVERINAELSPGEQPGEARLNAKVQEGPRSMVSATVDNDLSPSLGHARAGLRGQFYSPTGRGDILGWDLAAASGYRKASASYGIPITASDTTLEVFADLSRAKVVEQPLNALDIQSKSSTIGLRVNVPVLRTSREQLNLIAGLDVRQSESKLLGTGFAFSPGVEPDGRSRVSVLRFVQDYVGRDSGQVTAARSTFSLGTGAFGATDLGGTLPSGKFLAWLGQFQHARRLGKTDSQLVLRFDAQLTNQPLLPLEQFAVGGMRTVRGFRANQLVRDQGFAASVEFRVPVMRNPDGGAVLQIAPFVDVGGAWYKDRPTESPQRLSSAGVGLRWDPHPKLHAELYWAQTFAGRNVVNPSQSLQDRGWHLSLRTEF